MGKVVVTMRVMPKTVEVDLDKLKDDVKNALKDKVLGEVGFKKVPIAFGLVSLEVTFMMTEQEGGTDPAEKAVSQIPNVQGADVIEVTLV